MPSLTPAQVLLITPPMVQLNAPYAATPYLTGFLRARGIQTQQADFSLRLACRVFSAAGLREVADTLQSGPPTVRNIPVVKQFLRNAEAYVDRIEPVLGFLRGQNPALAYRLVTRRFLPEGPRFANLDAGYLAFAFGQMGVQDHAKHLASLYVDDLADVVREGLDSRFGLARYAERLAASLPEIDPLLAELARPPTLLDNWLDEITREAIARQRPAVAGLTVPFPGTLYGALRIAASIRAVAPETVVVMGGGYVSTELRQLREPRLFDLVDYVILDDGCRPFECLIEHLAGDRPASGLLRTFRRRGKKVEYLASAAEPEVPLAEAGTPTCDGLPLDRYFPLVEMPNPMYRLWADGCWQKLLLARGCYWHRCAFCDVSLDYIRGYDPAPAEVTVARMLSLIAETGQTGFHFVDEAAAPAVLKRLCRLLLARKVTATWWVNIRFEPRFTDELVQLMAAAGCIAVTGGLETASDRLLQLMNKGITMDQAAKVLQRFSQNGIRVHAYLMYGFPTQTMQETVDGLERIRQLFAEGCLDSAYWHRFAATVHSPVGQNPAAFGAESAARLPAGAFADNELQVRDLTGADPEALAPGLRKALYNYMLGVGLDTDVREWFETPVPRPAVTRPWLRRLLAGSAGPKSGGRGR